MYLLISTSCFLVPKSPLTPRPPSMSPKKINPKRLFMYMKIGIHECGRKWIILMGASEAGSGGRRVIFGDQCPSLPSASLNSRPWTKVVVLLQQKADPNQVDLAGHSALLCAVQSGSVELTQDGGSATSDLGTRGSNWVQIVEMSVSLPSRPFADGVFFSPFFLFFVFVSQPGFVAFVAFVRVWLLWLYQSLPIYLSM